MTSKEDYAFKHRERYLSWCAQVERSPFTALDRLEMGIISAHCPMSHAKQAFLDSRGVTGAQELANTLDRAGVLAPARKAEYIMRLREGLERGTLALPAKDYRAWRRTHKLPGLGHCKLSFGIALNDPLGSNVVCLDTHIARLYGANAVLLQRKLHAYEDVESLLCSEAADMHMPPFAYQWAIWDWARLTLRHPPDNHSFLWTDGQTDQQARLPLFSGIGA